MDPERRRTAAVVVGICLVLGSCGGGMDRSAGGIDRVTTSPPARAARHRVRPRSGHRIAEPHPRATLAPIHALADALADAVPSLRRALVACLTVPERCDMSAVVVPGSPAAAQLAADVADLVLWNLGRSPEVSGDRLSVRDLTTTGADTAVARLCIVDDLPLVDRVDPSDPTDDIPYANPLLSVMVRWDLRWTSVGWRLVDQEVIGRYPESDTCEVRHD